MVYRDSKTAVEIRKKIFVLLCDYRNKTKETDNRPVQIGVKCIARYYVRTMLFHAHEASFLWKQQMHIHPIWQIQLIYWKIKMLFYEREMAEAQNFISPLF
jgi:hypothetical protein